MIELEDESEEEESGSLSGRWKEVLRRNRRKKRVNRGDILMVVEYEEEEVKKPAKRTKLKYLHEMHDLALGVAP